MKNAKARFIIFKDINRQFRWHVLTRNGRIIAESGEAYNRKAQIFKTLRLTSDSNEVKLFGVTATIVDETL